MLFWCLADRQVVASMGVPKADVGESLRGSFMRDLSGERRKHVVDGSPVPYSFASLKTWLWVAHHMWEVEQPWRRIGDPMTQASQEDKGTNPTEDPQKVSLTTSV